MSISIAVKHMLAAGMSAEAIVTAVSEMEAAQAKPRSSGAIRQERYSRRIGLPAHEWQALRKRVFERDGFVCTYCGIDASDAPQCDHVEPLLLGGSSAIENLTTACRPCNSSKSGRSLKMWSGRK